MFIHTLIPLVISSMFSFLFPIVQPHSSPNKIIIIAKDKQIGNIQKLIFTNAPKFKKNTVILKSVMILDFPHYCAYYLISLKEYYLGLFFFFLSQNLFSCNRTRGQMYFKTYMNTKNYILLEILLKYMYIIFVMHIQITQKNTKNYMKNIHRITILVLVIQKNYRCT